MRLPRSRRTFRSSPCLQILIFAAGIFAALLAPVLARMLYFACSRRREFLADASAARLTRYPAGLASALETIAKRHSRRRAAGGPAETSRVLAPMFIVNPRAAWGASGAFATHPPTEKRIEILRDMSGRADYEAYESAYRRAYGKHRSCIGEVTLHADRRRLSARDPRPEVQAETTAERLRDVGDWLGRVADFALLTCACGVGIKIPPGYKREHVHCARCGRDHTIPTAVVAASVGLATAGANAVAGPDPGAGSPSTERTPAPEGRLEYRRRGEGWESFRCPKCGKNTHLSPAFEAPRIRCAGCRRHVAVLPREAEPRAAAPV